ncbi:hypothetical protein PUN28_005951 [Cardiocondyla obscurior]|uniref:Uncharacterized protein n=1 Tax=Cardiocondyla obscurior TaxID=286306 RepID=A0AAW2G994_9HYME
MKGNGNPPAPNANFCRIQKRGTRATRGAFPPTHARTHARTHGTQAEYRICIG